MNDQQQMLLKEWEEIRESIRYFGNKRFAQLTVFIAINGFMFEGFFRNNRWTPAWLLPVAGMVLGILFFFMEYCSVRYWTKFADRGKKIEQELGSVIQLMTQYRRPEKIFSATGATYAAYGGIVILWALLSFGVL